MMPRRSKRVSRLAVRRTIWCTSTTSSGRATMPERRRVRAAGADGAVGDEAEGERERRGGREAEPALGTGGPGVALGSGPPHARCGRSIRRWTDRSRPPAPRRPRSRSAVGGLRVPRPTGARRADRVAASPGGSPSRRWIGGPGAAGAAVSAVRAARARAGRRRPIPGRVRCPGRGRGEGADRSWSGQPREGSCAPAGPFPGRGPPSRRGRQGDRASVGEAIGQAVDRPEPEDGLQGREPALTGVGREPPLLVARPGSPVAPTCGGARGLANRTRAPRGPRRWPRPRSSAIAAPARGRPGTRGRCGARCARCRAGVVRRGKASPSTAW